MSKSNTEQELQSLLQTVLLTRFCSAEYSDFEACRANHVPMNSDNSYVDQALMRRGLRQCEPYQEALSRCCNDDSKHTYIMQKAMRAPTCKSERQAFAQCQRSGRKCTEELHENLLCGLIHIVQKHRQQIQQQQQHKGDDGER